MTINSRSKKVNRYYRRIDAVRKVQSYTITKHNADDPYVNVTCSNIRGW